MHAGSQVADNVSVFQTSQDGHFCLDLHILLNRREIMSTSLLLGDVECLCCLPTELAPDCQYPTPTL